MPKIKLLFPILSAFCFVACFSTSSIAESEENIKIPASSSSLKSQSGVFIRMNYIVSWDKFGKLEKFSENTKNVVSSQSLIGYSIKTGTMIQDYSPDYDMSYKGGNIELGYSLSGYITLGVEASYKRIDLKEPSKDIADGSINYSMFEVQRNSPLYSDQTVNATNVTANEKNALSFLTQPNSDGSVSAGSKLGFKIQNAGTESFNYMVNASLAIPHIGNSLFSPFVSVGGGIVFLDAFNVKTRLFAYQFKGGLNFALSPNSSLNVGYYYLNTISKDISDILPVIQIPEIFSGGGKVAGPASGTAQGRFKFALQGIEIGTEFIFSS